MNRGSALLLCFARNVPLLAVFAALLPAQTTRKDIVYDCVADCDLFVDLYSPPSGGYWRGSKANPQADWLTAHAYPAASIACRLRDTAKFPARIEDAKSAVRILRANPIRYVTADELRVLKDASHGGPAFQEAERNQGLLAFLDEHFKRHAQ